MREFRSFERYEGRVKEQIINTLGEAGLMEVYNAGDWRHLDNFHTDFIGNYVGDFWDCIPEGAEVRWRIMDAPEYDKTLLANCCGCNAEDFVCEETGKVLVVQFYELEEEES